MKSLTIIIILLPFIDCTLEPLSYDILIRIPEEIGPSVSFSASLSLHLLVHEPTSSILLNAVDLSAFRNVILVGFDQEEHPLKGIRITEEHVEFMFNELDRGEYILHIGDYVGRMGDGSAGVFVRGASLYTHLQPSFARRILPCIDLPSVRAPFRISIEHSQSTIAFSNTASVEERMVKGRKLSTFGTTPSLPAYLLAFSVIPDSVLQLSAQTSFGVTLRVIGLSQSTLLRVLRTAIAAFEYLADVIRIPLPLNKMDIFLVESYEGGMENWGHILISSHLAETGDDAHLVHLIAHELTHHWIGNAASVATWAHICIQEDLTEVLAHKIVKHLMKKDDFERFRLAKYIEIQLAEDVVSPLHSLILPHEITPQMIWTHCYLKGVIHLESIESVIGEDALLTIIRSLITSSNTFDLSSFTSHLSSYSVKDNITLSDVYYHAYSTGGYPTIDVSISDSSIRIDQSAPSLWPLHLSLSNGSSHWLLTSSESLSRRKNSTSRLDNLVNVNFKSFIRVNYDNRTWNEVIDVLESNPMFFTPVARAQFISDLCFFSSAFVDKRLIDRVMTIVYENPRYFDLCDWTLLWCRNSQQLSASSLLQKALVNLSSFFTSASDYKCRSGEAILAVNKICQSLFGKSCI